MTGDERSLTFAMAFCDRVLRPESDAAAAREFAALGRGPAPPFLVGTKLPPATSRW